MTPPSVGYGTRILATGSCTPPKVVTNHDLAEIMDTSDEWIQQRTGIKQRHVSDQEKGEGTVSLAIDAAVKAFEGSGLDASELDLIICATCTQEMTCPSVACRISERIGSKTAAAFDLAAACSGFLYGLNFAESLIRCGRFKNALIVGADAMSTVMDYSDRSVSILFGDAAGSAVIARDEDSERGCIHQIMGADGVGWEALYMPRREVDIPEWDRENSIKLGMLRMNGREVFKFAVKKFQAVIEETLEQSGHSIDEVALMICHQSNLRIIESAREKLGIAEDKVYVNIDRVGNSSAGSIGLCLDELNASGRIKEGELILFVAFGGGMTWASSLWRV
ncbi:MAG: beta-ketoacyl-ACP synthase III [Planctomycetota bacterium]|nr:beta-ketoacyl-ACP synthase III [Planctomycetota bacterium]